LKNEGNDVGVTKTLAHELTHEILHQRYLKENNPKFKEYFIGTSEGRELVEQQAEISAWLILASYGFDLKTTSLNYAAIWGADKNQMIKVFDMVSGVVNMLLDYINARINTVSEAGGANIAPAKHITPDDVADFLGVEQEFDQLKKKEMMVENFFRLVKKVI
jgi:antirestriction protein ArdC